MHLTQRVRGSSRKPFQASLSHPTRLFRPIIKTLEILDKESSCNKSMACLTINVIEFSNYEFRLARLHYKSRKLDQVTQKGFLDPFLLAFED